MSSASPQSSPNIPRVGRLPQALSNYSVYTPSGWGTVGAGLLEGLRGFPKKSAGGSTRGFMHVEGLRGAPQPDRMRLGG